MGLALFDGVLEVVCLGMGEILGGIGRVISEKSLTLGEITDTGVIRYLGPGPNKRSRRFDTPTS